MSGIQVECLTRTFDGGPDGVHDVTLQVRPGRIYVLMGGNGSGKTTLINLCLGHLRPDRGTITIAGRNVVEDPTAAKRRLAYVPEVARLYDQLTACENMRFFEELNGRTPARALMHDTLARLRFPQAALGQPASTFSKGRRQKVVIASGLLKRADVFLLDEPTSGLDPGSAAHFRHVVQTLKDENKAVLISSHDVHDVLSYADDIGMLHRGRMIRQCEASTLDLATLTRCYPEWSDA
jgi:ABC-2 type transport system ATP-binding protein